MKNSDFRIVAPPPQVRRGRRPYDIHQLSPALEVHHLFLSSPRFPHDWSSGLVQLIAKVRGTLITKCEVSTGILANNGATVFIGIP